MADTQQAPQSTSSDAQTGSLWEAQDAILGLLEPEKETPAEEKAESEEVEESTEETQQEATESESEEEVPQEASEEDSEVSEEDEAEEEVTEEEEAQPELYTVKINGEEFKISEEELVKGYSRQADYTRKTQELSEYRKQLDQAANHLQGEVEQTHQARQHYIDSVSNAIQSNFAGLQKFANTDWEKLKAEDKEEYLTRKDEYREAQEHIGRLQQQQQQVLQEQQIESQQQQSQVVRSEHSKMASILPEWNDPEKRRGIANEVKSFALSKGYTQEELSQLVDHRSILVLMQAKAWEDDQIRLRGIKGKKIKNKPKVVKSGKGEVKAENRKSKYNAKMKNLRDTGHINDAVSMIEDLLQ